MAPYGEIYFKFTVADGFHAGSSSTAKALTFATTDTTELSQTVA